MAIVNITLRAGDVMYEVQRVPLGSRMVMVSPGGERFPVQLFVSLLRITMLTSDGPRDHFIPSARHLRSTHTILKCELRKHPK